MPIINSVIAGGGAPAPSGKYQLLQRVSDDNNNEIGTVVGFHLDANDVEYAVVCLDAVYRLASGQLTSANGAIANLPTYMDSSAVYGARETATFNCDKILDWVAAEAGRSSVAVTHCRSQTFVIGGDTYAGQLPTLMELLKILEFRSEVNTTDPTATTNPTLIIPNSTNTWSSTQSYSAAAWRVNLYGKTDDQDRTRDFFIAPVLELPNA